MADDLDEHYGPALPEDSRLTRTPHGRLELLRTQELVRRHLEVPGLRVLDVGGGTGVHARWLADDGHDVHVIDPVRDHVAATAVLPGVTAEVGDARGLPSADASVDVVLLLGPLYHLRHHHERARALSEAHRVLRPGGLLVAAAISRYLTLLELGGEGRLTPELKASVQQVVASGDYDAHAGFVPAHFHTATELAGEVADAGLHQVEVYGVEGPTWPALDVAGLDALDARLEAALVAARMAEQDPHLIHASAHLVAFAHK